MKLATYQDGSKDGQLVVVSRDLKLAHYATGVCHTMQQLLDDWNFLSPQLQDVYDALNRDPGQGITRYAFPFEEERCLAPLPRLYQWASGAAVPAGDLTLQSGGAAEQVLSVFAGSSAAPAHKFAFLIEAAMPQATALQLREAARLVVPIVPPHQQSGQFQFHAVAATLDEYAQKEGL